MKRIALALVIVCLFSTVALAQMPTSPLLSWNGYDWQRMTHGEKLSLMVGMGLSYLQMFENQYTEEERAQNAAMSTADFQGTVANLSAWYRANDKSAPILEALNNI